MSTPEQGLSGGFTTVTVECERCGNDFSYRRSTYRSKGSFKSNVKMRRVCDRCTRSDKDRVRLDEQLRQGFISAAERHRRNYVFGFRMEQSPSFGGPEYGEGPRVGAPMHEQGWPMADAECEHGRCSGDRLDGLAPNWPHKHPCGCFPEEGEKPEEGMRFTCSQVATAVRVGRPGSDDDDTGDA
jgi:hypothetical protein